MDRLSEKAQWEDGIYELRIMDPVLGGTDGISNRQAAQLANRTQWLKEQAAAQQKDLNEHDSWLHEHDSRLDGCENSLGTQQRLLAGHGTAADPHPQYTGQFRAVAEGTADAITADFGFLFPEHPTDMTTVFVRAQAANSTGEPVFTPYGFSARSIRKGTGQPLREGDIAGPGYPMMLQYDAALACWLLLNPAYGSREDAATPVGAVNWWPLPEPPAGWLVRDGSILSRDSFAALFAIIGTRYGEGDGISTFALPDDRGNFIRGWDSGRGKDANRIFGNEQEDAIRNITGTFTAGRTSFNVAPVTSGSFTGSAATGPSWDYSKSYGYYKITLNASRSVPTAAENRPRNRAYLPIIKYR